MRRLLAVTILTWMAAGCHGSGGPMERAGRSVDHAVYDVGTGIKKAGQKIQQTAE